MTGCLIRDEVGVDDLGNSLAVHFSDADQRQQVLTGGWFVHRLSVHFNHFSQHIVPKPRFHAPQSTVVLGSATVICIRMQTQLLLAHTTNVSDEQIHLRFVINRASINGLLPTAFGLSHAAFHSS